MARGLPNQDITMARGLLTLNQDITMARGLLNQDITMAGGQLNQDTTTARDQLTLHLGITMAKSENHASFDIKQLGNHY